LTTFLADANFSKRTTSIEFERLGFGDENRFIGR